MNPRRAPKATTRQRFRAKRAYRKLGRTRAERRAALVERMAAYFAESRDRLTIMGLTGPAAAFNGTWPVSHAAIQALKN